MSHILIRYAVNRRFMLKIAGNLKEIICYSYQLMLHRKILKEMKKHEKVVNKFRSGRELMNSLTSS
jgi:hypothetical protein